MRLVLLSLALFAFKHNSVECARCLYGDLPGHFLHMRALMPPGQNYQLFSANCQLGDKIKPYLDHSERSPKRIAFVGDVSDAHLVRYACDLFKTNITQSEHMLSCKTESGLELYHVLLTHGTRKEDSQKLKHLYDHFTRERVKPDLLVFSSFYWALNNYIRGAPDDMYMLTYHQIEHYIAINTDLIHAARRLFPLTRIVAHNAVDAGSPNRRAHTAQLNSALRHIVHASAVELVDYELASAAFAPETLLSDGVNPKAFFLLEMMNVLLHI